MSIRYDAARGTILLCDYSLGGFREPEMVKRRPAIVVSPRLPRRDGLCAVVPLSGTEPQRPVPYVVRLELDEELLAPFSQRVWWAKCDMVATVSFERLDFFRTARDQIGKRQYRHPKVTPADFERVLAGVQAGLGLPILTSGPRSPNV